MKWVIGNISDDIAIGEEEDMVINTRNDAVEFGLYVAD